MCLVKWDHGHYAGAESADELINNDLDLLGLRLNNTATNEQALKKAQELQEYLDKNIDNLSQDLVNMITGFINQIENEVDKDAAGQFENKQKYQLAKVTQNDDGSLKQEIQDYEAQLKKQQELEEKYNNETNAEKKEALKESLADEYEKTEEMLNKVKALYNKDDSEQSTLSESKILEYLGFNGNESQIKTNIYAGLDEEQTNIYNEIRKELTETGKLEDKTKQKLADLKSELRNKEDGESWIQAMNDDLAEAGNLSKINLEKGNMQNEYNNTQNDSEIEQKKQEAAQILQDLYSYEMGFTDDYLEKAGGNILKIQDAVNADKDKLNQLTEEIENLENSEYNNVSSWLDGVNASLSDLGMNIDAKWYQDISEQLKNGEIDFETFYNTVSENCQKLGIDLDDLKSAFSSVTEEVAALGTQSDFVENLGEIEDLYDKAANLKSGKTIDTEDLTELRNKYQEVNDYIAETGDLTLKNGQLLMDLGDNMYESGQEALEKQITSLEDYQDAILNTVDAMGIMADFKTELAALDEELAETITDDSVAEAKAKGQYVDFTQEVADGVYDANETVMMSEDALYNQTQASIQGILDSKQTEADVTQEYADTELAINDAIQTSDAATAEQKAASAQWVGDAKLTEAEITTGAADTEAVAEGSSAEASAQGASAKADSQSVAAQAAITTGQTFIDMARAIAEAEGVEASGLDEAANKLSELQTNLDAIDGENASNAAKAAAAYKEAQAKIQEAKARLGQYKGVNKTGSSNYSNAGSSGSSGSSSKSDAEKLQEDIEDFREDEGTALEDVTEELIKQYETEERKLQLQKKNLDYANDLLDSEEDTTKWLKVQEQLLKNQRKQIQENYRENSKLEQQYSKIKKENSKYDIDSWFDENGDATLAYKNLLNSFAIEEKEYRATVSINSEEDLEAAEEHIEKIKEQKEYVENLFDSAQKLKQAWVENNEEIQDLFVEMNDTLKEMRDTLLDKFINQLEREVEETNQTYQDNIDKLDALITVQERYNDVINDAKDTQAELKKELQSNKDSYQYLDDYMRSIIFNEDDYNVLSEELDNIMSQANDLAEEYQTKINSLTEDEMYKIEEITNEYERQVDELEKQYELKKAELDVVKAQTKLENAQNERTVRMFVNRLIK